ncbi:SAM-dependent methyltransferase [Parashewanella curva]|uniref:SAM-dependent methyltransferase n=1 Tax=Parashewanella curva TaxID=2338552 RepID=A0A3L8Q0L5_9GAMM|nr:class I SAM-dependent methyltransferase [Parashewanella curva]RLV61115.1 SAM-dependent methyltransferase [Parashewanella curva]
MQSFITFIQQLEIPQDTQRLFHGRGGKYPQSEHLCLDWFEPVLLITSFKPLEDSELEQIVDAIKQRWQQLAEETPLNLVYQFRSGLGTKTQLICGQVPEPHVVTENGNQYNVHLLKGQNHGLFLDMRNGRQWVQQNTQGKKVLNLFAYTCGFSIAALAGGAESVVNIDMSKGALSIGKRNHNLNDFVGNASFYGHDIFKSWGKLKKQGPYDLIIADPPSNQKGSFVATKDYVRLLRRLPELMSEQCELLLCLNAPELSPDFLKQQVEESINNLIFVGRVANPAVYADIDEEKSLKVFHYKK